MRIYIGTHYIEDSEPCYRLEEVNLQSPGSRGFHRYQILTVVRNDKLAQFKIDLGKAEDFKADQLIILGGVVDDVTGKLYIEETVGRLRNMADRYRNEKLIEKEQLPRTDILKEFTEKAEREIKRKRKGDYTQYGYSKN